MAGMNVSGVAEAINTTYVNSSVKNEKSESKKSEGKKEKEVTDEKSAVYEKTEKEKPATYNINKMSAEQRAQIVSQLKTDQENRMKQLTDLVSQMLTDQATTFAKTDDSMWKFLASGKFTVDPATKAQAQADIAEDGYFGVKQTAQRMFDFASAIAGDDVDKMKKMEEAMGKGFKQATKTWGQALPQICQDTMKAAHDMFSDYYASKEVTE